MFLQQTDKMLLCYNILPLHHPVERFYERKSALVPSISCGLKGPSFSPVRERYVFVPLRKTLNKFQS